MVHDHGNAENVLVLQGGGSLGAFSCGVFKAFAARGIKVDIIAGTSIGGVNAAIVAGSKGDRPEAARAVLAGACRKLGQPVAALAMAAVATTTTCK